MPPREVPVIGALIVTHGNLAHELLNAARQIEADVSGMVAVPLDWNDTVDEAREKIAGGLAEIGPKRDVIIFTDMFGGTPSNISLSFLEQGHVEIVTGVNLPMIVKFAMVKQEAKDVATLAHVISEKGSTESLRAASSVSCQMRAKVVKRSSGTSPWAPTSDTIFVWRVSMRGSG